MYRQFITSIDKKKIQYIIFISLNIYIHPISKKYNKKTENKIIKKESHKKIRSVSYIIIQTINICNVLEWPIPGAKP